MNKIIIICMVLFSSFVSAKGIVRDSYEGGDEKFKGVPFKGDTQLFKKETKCLEVS